MIQEASIHSTDYSTREQQQDSFSILCIVKSLTAEHGRIAQRTFMSLIGAKNITSADKLHYFRKYVGGPV